MVRSKYSPKILTLANMDSKLQKLKELKQKRQESLQLNKNQVIAADQKQPKEPLKAKRKLAKAQELLQEQELQTQGIDPERVKNLSYTIQDSEAWNQKLAEKADQADKGFSDYTQIQAQKYKKMINDFVPNLQNYTADIDKLNFVDHKPRPEAVARLVETIEKDTKKRANFSKRRRHDEDQEV